MSSLSEPLSFFEGPGNTVIAKIYDGGTQNFSPLDSGANGALPIRGKVVHVFVTPVCEQRLSVIVLVLR
jgi:hypothetical protein